MTTALVVRVQYRGLRYHWRPKRDLTRALSLFDPFTALDERAHNQAPHA